MSTPKDHHYLPKVYLKEFSNSQKQLFQIIKGQKTISLKSIGQVCYEPDYFKFSSKENLLLHNIDDVYHIEKNAFKKQENSYSNHLKKITFPSLTSVEVKKSELLSFLETLITIKRRNPTYRKEIIKSYKEYITSEQFKKDAELGIEISKRIDKIDPVEYLENYINEAITDKSKQSDFYLQGFLDKENRITAHVAETLIQFKTYIYHAPLGCDFITSDNPGFTMMPNGQLYSFGGFATPFTFIFPLTPKCCLFISHQFMDKDHLNLNKKIHVIHTDANFVNTVNDATCQLAIKRIFSYRKEALSKL